MRYALGLTQDLTPLAFAIAYAISNREVNGEPVLLPTALAADTVNHEWDSTLLDNDRRAVTSTTDDRQNSSDLNSACATSQLKVPYKPERHASFFDGRQYMQDIQA